jgi:DNA-binding YbaB/EbfC family protein
VNPDPGDLLARFSSLQSEMQERLRSLRVEASAGGGMVTVTCNGLADVVGVRISPEVVDPADVEQLEDLVRAAIGEAQSRARQAAQQQLAGLFGALPPDIFGNLPA